MSVSTVKKNKILIATGIFPPDIGGPATMVAALAESLTAQGMSVKVITYSSATTKINAKTTFDVIRVNKNPKFLAHLVYFFRLLFLAMSSDLIYVTDAYSVGYYCYWLKRISHRKYIFRYSGDSAWETAVGNGWTDDGVIDFQTKIYDRKIEQLKTRRNKILHNADNVIVVSRFLAKIAKMAGVSEDKISVIYNSIDFFNVPPDPNQVEKIKSQYGGQAKIIITACRLVPWKGIDTMIRILPALMQKSGPVSFLILGDGPEADNLKKLVAKQGLEKNVFLLGRIPHDEIIDYFLAGDLFVLNTNYEGLSHTLLEAMKAQVPIVATDVGGNKEVITNGQEGILVGYNNESELIAACTRILTDAETVKNFIAAAAIKLKQFNWEENINQTMAVIKKVIHK